MPFPPSGRVGYQKPQLEEVICQLRFPTILSIASKEPAGFQDRIRDVYPVYRRDEGLGGAPAEISSLLSRLPGVVGAGELLTHRFESGDSRTLSLTTSFIAVSFGEKRYRTWEEFSGEIERAQTALEGEYRPAYYNRIGLRYRDVIERTSLGLGNSPWSELIRGELLGALADDVIGQQIKGSRSEILLDVEEVPDGAARLRTGLVNKKLDDGSTQVAYLLDIDFYVEGKVERENVRGILDRFNRLAGYFFRWAITPRLSEALIPVAVPP